MHGFCKTLVLTDIPANTYDVMVTEKSCPSAVIKLASSASLPVVSLEWLVQSLIIGERQDYKSDPQYSHDYALWTKRPLSQTTQLPTDNWTHPWSFHLCLPSAALFECVIQLWPRISSCMSICSMSWSVETCSPDPRQQARASYSVEGLHPVCECVLRC